MLFNTLLEISDFLLFEQNNNPFDSSKKSQDFWNFVETKCEIKMEDQHIEIEVQGKILNLCQK